MKKLLAIVIFFVILLIWVFSARSPATTPSSQLWQFQSIDTMKYSRDLSREKLHDPVFDITITRQMEDIARTGATHVAIATPYDEEFVPMLTRWVKAARAQHLKVWFRGNFSGWEKWFEYPAITRAEHIQKTEAFILKYPELFVDGDVFSACPECENGGPGDPRRTGDAAGHRAFLISEYTVAKNAFSQIHKNVAANYNSMNGDVAKLIMDQDTTKKLDGIVVIDHYVGTTEKMKTDIAEIATHSGGNIILGEFGAPIPDINGKMTEDEQAAWLSETLQLFVKTPQVVGLSYWVNTGGSTELWNDAGVAKKAVSSLTTYYKPTTTTFTLQNPIGQAIQKAHVKMGSYEYTSGNTGEVAIPTVLLEDNTAAIQAQGYHSLEGKLTKENTSITLKKTQEDLLYRVLKILKSATSFRI